MQLEGKVALITGGGTGIGAAIAERFVAEGAKVCITGRRQEVLDEEASRIPRGWVITCAGDVANLNDATRMVERTIEFGGKLDVLVNNAGVDTAGSITEIDPSTWSRVIETNLTGPMYTMKVAIPYMKKAGGGSIINVASLAGLRCIPAMPAYCSSKAGLIMLTQQAALDYGVYKIRCNVVCPGGTRTAMIENSMAGLATKLNKDMDGTLAYFSKNVPLRRMASPQEMTGVCVYLAGEDSTFMTGAVLVLDGGAAIVDVNGTVVSDAGMSWGG
ncbi:MAG: SDR family oxidoreductase [Dehalococcoidales bacterium]|nr:SDR family oxidoreductase [Dehalococcoidales bacterium]